MSFLTAIPIDKAEGLVLNQYQAILESNSSVPNHVRAFSLRPEVFKAWNELHESIRRNMRLKRYELVTLAAAMALECSY